MGDTLYKDGSGSSILLFEHFFRTPADYNYLLGLQQQNHGYGTNKEDSEEFSQMKEIMSAMDDQHQNPKKKKSTKYK
jgi:hypothetical protein